MASMAAHGIRTKVPLLSLTETRSTVWLATTTGKKLDVTAADETFGDRGVVDEGTEIAAIESSLCFQ